VSDHKQSLFLHITKKIMNTHIPTHDEISYRAKEIWQDCRNPDGRDTEIWLEAEHQLRHGPTEPNSGGREPFKSVSKSTDCNALVERLNAETAAESVVEYNISPAVTEDEAVKAALQKSEARGPIEPTKKAKKAKPTESGKPLWNKPHSS
jgi:hypothetical protein